MERRRAIYCTKQGDIETSNYTLSHKLGSEQKERVSEQTNERSGAREQREQTEQANKWAVRVNERMDKQVVQYLRLDPWLFKTTVPPFQKQTS